MTTRTRKQRAGVNSTVDGDTSHTPHSQAAARHANDVWLPASTEDVGCKLSSPKLEDGERRDLVNAQHSFLVNAGEEKQGGGVR